MILNLHEMQSNTTIMIKTKDKQVTVLKHILADCQLIDDMMEQNNCKTLYMTQFTTEQIKIAIQQCKYKEIKQNKIRKLILTDKLPDLVNVLNFLNNENLLHKILDQWATLHNQDIDVSDKNYIGKIPLPIIQQMYFRTNNPVQCFLIANLLLNSQISRTVILNKNQVNLFIQDPIEQQLKNIKLKIQNAESDLLKVTQNQYRTAYHYQLMSQKHTYEKKQKELEGLRKIHELMDLNEIKVYYNTFRLHTATIQPKQLQKLYNRHCNFCGSTQIKYSKVILQDIQLLNRLKWGTDEQLWASIMALPSYCFASNETQCQDCGSQLLYIAKLDYVKYSGLLQFNPILPNFTSDMLTYPYKSKIQLDTQDCAIYFIRGTLKPTIDELIKTTDSQQIAEILDKYFPRDPYNLVKSNDWLHIYQY